MPEPGEWGGWWWGWRGRKDSCAGRWEEQEQQTWSDWYNSLLFSSNMFHDFQPTGNKMSILTVTDVVVSRRTDRERIPVRYCTLGTRDAARYWLLFWKIDVVLDDRKFLLTLTCILRDPHTLVELSAFSAINRFQPFNVAVSSNVLLLMASKKKKNQKQGN